MVQRIAAGHSRYVRTTREVRTLNIWPDDVRLVDHVLQNHIWQYRHQNCILFDTRRARKKIWTDRLSKVQTSSPTFQEPSLSGTG